MKSFLEKSKRALVLLLTGAMIATSVPADVFAAPLATDEDVIFEEGADGVEALGVADEVVVEEAVDPVEPDEAKAEIQIMFTKSAAVSSFNAKVIPYTETITHTPIYTGGTNESVYVDPDKDYTFIVEPNEGTAFDLSSATLASGSYIDYSTNTSLGVKVDVDNSTLNPLDVTGDDKDYYFKGTKVITIPKATLQAVRDGIHATDPSKLDDGILTVSFNVGATAAKWEISGFDLKDIELQDAILPSEKELVNGTNKDINLANIVKTTGLDVSDFNVAVLAFDSNNELAFQSKVLNAKLANDPSTLGSPSATDPSLWNIWYDGNPIDPINGTVEWVQYTQAGHVIIHGNAISYLYNNDYTVYLDITSKGTVGVVNIKATTDSEKYATFTTASPGSGEFSVAPTSAGVNNSGNTGKDLVFTVTKKTGYDYLQSVTWTVAGKSNDKYKATIASTQTAATVTIPYSDGLDSGDIVVTAKAAYSVAKSVSDPDYTILDKDGKTIVQATADEPLEFQIAHKDGNRVTSVAYQLGDGETESILPEEDGSFKIPKVTGAVKILPSFATITSGNAIVKLAETYNEINVYKIDEKGAATTKLTKTGSVSTKIGEPFLFTISHSGQKIEEVSYSLGSSTTKTVLSPVYGENHKDTYKIPNVSETSATIYVTYHAAATIYAPSNAKVTANFAATGKGIEIPQGNFNFTLTPATNVKITGVWINTSNAKGGTKLTGTDGGTFNATTAGPYYVYVESEETIPASEYKAVFTDYDLKISNTYEEGKAKTNGNIIDQKLKLVMGNSADSIYYSVYPIKDGKLRSALTPTEVKISAPDTTDYLKLDKTACTIEPKKVGDQDVTFQFKKDDKNGNSFVYPATLKVNVAQAYTDLEVVADKDTAYTYVSGTPNADKLDDITLVLKGKDGQTGLYGKVDVGSTLPVTQITWSFVPSTDQVDKANYEYAFVSTSTASGVTSGSAGAGGNGNAGDATAYVCAKKSNTVTVKAIVTYKDGTSEEVTKTLTFIDPLKDTYFMTRTINGAIDAFKTITTSTGGAYDNLGTLAVNVPDMKEVTVKYDVYKVSDATIATAINGGIYTAVDTKAKIDALITAKKVAKVDVTVGTAKLQNCYDNGAVYANYVDNTEYATLTSVEGGYKIVANKTNEASETGSIRFVAPTLSVDGISIPNLNYDENDVYFTIQKELDKNKVELITVDDQSEDSAHKKVNAVQTLKTSYINNRDYSEVKKAVDTAGRDIRVIGYEFNAIGEGVSFRLPEAADFESDPYAGKMLLGWVECTYSPSGAGAPTNGAHSLLAPGAYVANVTSNKSYKAVWYDKYVKYAGTKGDGSGQLMYAYDKTKSYVDDNGNVKYPVLVPASIEVGFDIPVVIGMGKVTSCDADVYSYSTSTGAQTIDPTKLNVKEEFYVPGEYTIAAKDANATFNLDATELAAQAIKSSENAKTGVATNVTVSKIDDAGYTWKEDKTFQFIAATTATVTIAGDANIPKTTSATKATSYESGVPATLTAALVDAGNAITLQPITGVIHDANKVAYNNYTFNWTSSDTAVATVKAGEKVKQDTAVLTPLAAGTSTITLSVMKSGKEIAKSEFELTVNASDVVITFADNEGNAGITEAVAHAGNANTNVFKVKVTNKAGQAITGGQIKFGASGVYNTNKVIAASQTVASVSSGDAQGFVAVPVNTKDFVGTDALHVTFENTVSGKKYTYQKDINIKTYYSVNLVPNIDTWITKDGVKQANADGTAKTVEIKLFEEDMKDVAATWDKNDATKKKDFNFKNISLNGYSAVYKDDTKEFSQWTVTTTGGYPSLTGTKYKENATIASLVGFAYKNANSDIGSGKSESNFATTTSGTVGLGTFTLTPEVASKITVSGAPGEVTMTYNSDSAKNNKTVSFNVAPTSYTTPLDVKGTKVGFYSLVDKLATPTSNKTVAPSSGKTSFVIKGYPGYDATDKETWKAGSDVITVTGPSASKALATINLYINGLNYDTATKKVQYFENGEIVKSDYRTVNGDTYYFDADGNWIESTGITKIDNKNVLIIGGVVAPKGKNVHDGKTYYVGDNGIILTGWLASDGTAATAANGVYYADPEADGKLVTGLQTIDGKKYIFGSDNKVSRATNTVGAYEAINGYYVNAEGQIAENGIFDVKTSDGTVPRLFRADASIVSFGDPDVSAEGKITLNGQSYTIEKGTHKATADDIKINPVVEWTKGYDNKFSKGSAAPVLSYKITYQYAKAGTTDSVEGTVTATSDDNFTTGSTAETVTFTAKVSLEGFFTDAEGKTPAQDVTKSVTYRFKDGGVEGISDIWYAPTVTWTTTWPAKWTKDPAYPTMKYKVSYTSKESGTTTTTEELTAIVTSNPVTILAGATEATFTATADLSAYYTDDTGATAVDPATIANATSSKKYIFKDGGAEGVAGTYSIKSKTAFTWGELPATGVPTASLTIIYTVTQEDGTNTTETVTTNATVTETTATGDTKHRSFKAVAATMDEKNPEITDTKIYSVKSGSGMEGIVIEGLQDEYEYAGTPIQPAFYLVDYDIEDGVVLALGTDYTAKYTNNKAAGTGTITITGKGNYAGKNLTASFKIVDPFAEADKTEFADNVKKVVVSADGFTYDGTQKFPKTVTITTKAGETLVYEFDGTSYNKTSGDKEVLITVANNVKAGTATVGAQGKNDAKPKTGKFKIAPLDLSGAGDKLAVTINGGDNAVYEVKGVQPSVEVVYTTEDGDALLLVQGQDYKLSFKNNKAAGTGTAILKGQKNCTKKKEVSFTIDKINLEDVDTDTVSIVALSGKKVSSVKPVVTDAVGNAIPTKAFKVSIFEAGKETALDKKATIPAEFDIKIEANDTVNLENAIEISGLQTVNDFGKAKIVVDKTWNKAGIAYTGSPIILTDLVDDDNANPFENGKITVKVGSATLVYGEDFEVAGYANNIKKGNMTFTLYGINKYAGSKSGKVKIVAKTIAKIEAE